LPVTPAFSLHADVPGEFFWRCCRSRRPTAAVLVRDVAPAPALQRPDRDDPEPFQLIGPLRGDGAQVLPIVAQVDAPQRAGLAVLAQDIVLRLQQMGSAPPGRGDRAALPSH